MGERVEMVIRLDPEMHVALKASAEANERTMAGEVRMALRKHLAPTDNAHCEDRS